MGALAFDQTPLGLGEFRGHRSESFEPAMIDLAALDRGAYSAIGLGAMCAVIESTILSDGDDVSKHPVQRVLGIPQPNRAHPGSVDEDAPTRQH